MSSQRLVHQPAPPNSNKVGSPTFSSNFNQGWLTNLLFHIQSWLAHQLFLLKVDVVVCCVLKQNDMSLASCCLFRNYTSFWLMFSFVVFSNKMTCRLHPIVLFRNYTSFWCCKCGVLLMSSGAHFQSVIQKKYQNKLSNANNILKLIIPQNT